MFLVLSKFPEFVGQVRYLASKLQSAKVELIRDSEKILVGGGTGYIGSHTVVKLLVPAPAS